jgi:hypothetical protein
MAEAGNEAVRITPHPFSLEDMNRLWAMFSNKAFSLSVTYVVSPVRVPSSKELHVARVMQKITTVKTR